MRPSTVPRTSEFLGFVAASHVLSGKFSDAHSFLMERLSAAPRRSHGQVPVTSATDVALKRCNFESGSAWHPGNNSLSSTAQVPLQKCSTEDISSRSQPSDPEESDKDGLHSYLSHEMLPIPSESWHLLINFDSLVFWFFSTGQLNSWTSAPNLYET